MEIANIHEAKSQLSKLVEHAMNGEEVIIAKAGQPMVRLVPVHANESPRLGGQWKGRVRIAHDFDTLARRHRRRLRHRAVMTLLLDTHAFLWWIFIAMRLKPGFDAVLTSPSQVLIQLSPTFSAASVRKMSVSRASIWQKKSLFSRSGSRSAARACE